MAGTFYGVVVGAGRGYTKASDGRAVLSVAKRVCEPEVMDQPGLDESLHRQALKGLKRVNALTRTPRHVWYAAEAIWRPLVGSETRRLRWLDLACGGGDVTLGIARLAKKHAVPLELVGWDKSETAVNTSNHAAHAEGLTNVRFEAHDVLADEVPAKSFDVVYSTLFFHHLSEGEAVQLLQQMRRGAATLVIVDDLIRSALGYWLAKIGCHLLSRSPIVHNDGPISVRAAFTQEEFRDLALQAGMRQVEFKRHFPERFLMTAWTRNDQSHDLAR